MILQYLLLSSISPPKSIWACVSSRPTGQPNPKDLAENRRFQANLKDLLEIENRANLRICSKMIDFNTLVLKSRCFGFSEISDEISEGD